MTSLSCFANFKKNNNFPLRLVVFQVGELQKHTHPHFYVIKLQDTNNWNHRRFIHNHQLEPLTFYINLYDTCISAK